MTTTTIKNRLVRRIWEDIKQGENIDLYVTAIVALILAGLAATPVQIDPYIAPVTLAVLAMIAASMLGIRHRLEDIQQQTQKQVNYLEEYPPEILRKAFEEAEELWLLGINLEHTIRAYWPLLETMLRRGGKLSVLVMKPDGDAIDISIMRSFLGVGKEDACSDIRRTLRNLCTFKASAPERVRISTLDYPLPFGAFVVDPYATSGMIFLENYTLGSFIFRAGWQNAP